MRSGASTVAAERAATHLLDQDGFAVIPDVFDAEKCDALSLRLIGNDLDRVGLRGMLDLPWCEALGQRLLQHPFLIDFLPREFVPVQCTRFGRLTAETAVETRAQNGETVVPISRGGALVMRPLLLHASSKATEAGPRRVLHFVFGPALLPLGLDWAVRHS